MNTNWSRWIFASVSKFFDDRRNNIKLLFEGQDVPLKRGNDYAELRITGPETRQISNHDYRLEITINILINISKDQDDAHKHLRITGIFEKAFESCIPIFKYGNGPDDDQSQLPDSLALVQSGNQDIVTVQYGQIVPDIKEMQATVEGRYRVFLKDQ